MLIGGKKRLETLSAGGRRIHPRLHAPRTSLRGGHKQKQTRGKRPSANGMDDFPLISNAGLFYFSSPGTIASTGH